MSTVRISDSRVIQIDRVRMGDDVFHIKVIKGLRLIARADMIKHKISEKGTLDRLTKLGVLTTYFENGTVKKVKSTATSYYDLNEWLQLDMNKN